MKQWSRTALYDDSRDMFKYKTYDFEFTNAQDPLMEKELFKALEQQLTVKKMKRVTENPDLLIIMTYFTGQKEQYTPPQQIVSSHIKTVYSWNWGLIPIPITETTTKEGYTDVTYLTTISLKFLDADEIEGSKLPPVVWSGTLSQTSKIKKPLLENSWIYFSTMLAEFPEVWVQNSDYYYSKPYSYTGLWFNKNDLQTISEVNPGSPAYKIGIQKGDKILSINKYKIPAKYSEVGPDKFGVMAYEGNQSGFRYLFMPTGLVFQPYKDGVTTLVFKIKRDGKKMSFELTPEKKHIFLEFTK